MPKDRKDGPTTCSAWFTKGSRLKLTRTTLQRQPSPSRSSEVSSSLEAHHRKHHLERHQRHLDRFAASVRQWVRHEEIAPVHSPEHQQVPGGNISGAYRARLHVVCSILGEQIDGVPTRKHYQNSSDDESLTMSPEPGSSTGSLPSNLRLSRSWKSSLHPPTAPIALQHLCAKGWNAEHCRTHPSP